MRGREGLLRELPGLHLYGAIVSVVNTMAELKHAVQTYGFAIYDARYFKW